MIKILVDTNIVMDLLSKREPFYQSAADLFSLADTKRMKLSISALTLANVQYVLQKEIRGEAKEVLRRFKVLVQVLSLNDKILDLALNDNDFKDFEDAIQYFTAIDNEHELILTRNLKDFKKSTIPVMTAEVYLNTHHD